jgi:DNA transposition AAA+ family ATPase
MATMIETQETAEEVRLRLLAVKQETGRTWKALAQSAGIPEGTLSSFGSSNYGGDILRVASEVRRFLDGRANLALLKPGAVKDPGFLPTQTSREITTLLQWAQTGEVVAIAAGPGTGKTRTLLEYAENYPNVWLATMSPSTSGVQPMQLAVLEAMATVEAKGSPQQLSARILAKARDSGGLIAIDEAQELSEKSLDEVRSWHDKTGIGIALVGDERVIGRLGGIRRAELGRLHSRISMRITQAHPKPDDAAVIIHGWGVKEPAQVKFLQSLATKPGGLRGIAKTIKLAGLMAAGEDRPVTLSDLQEAWAQRNTELMGA